nr:nucleoside triphosphate pyrophosphatase [Nakamurella flavida]
MRPGAPGRVRVVLGSASPARLGILRAAGIDPLVIVAGVDEDAVLAGVADRPFAERVAVLAEAKAQVVVDRILAGTADLEPADGPLVVIGCDSMLLLDDELQGKPHTADQAHERWARMAGRSGDLLTGHALIHLAQGAERGRTRGTGSTVVRIGSPTAHEIDAYVATGEPLAVAGALTLDGYGGWFVDGVDGDPSNVIGLSLPLTRTLLAELGLSVVDLWRPPSARPAP